MFPGKVFTSFAKFCGIVIITDFRFPRRLQELFEALFCFLRSFLFCTDMIESTVLPNLVPRQLIGDCFEIHILHSELCDPQLPNHQHFPLFPRLQEALVILALKQISQFRSFGKSVKNIAWLQKRNA